MGFDMGSKAFAIILLLAQVMLLPTVCADWHVVGPAFGPLMKLTESHGR